MVLILKDLKSTCKMVKEFYAILSDDLAAVTGSRTKIDYVREKINDHVLKLSGFLNDIFLPENAADWDATFKNFKTNMDQVEEETVTLIQETFSGQLNSAAGAFELLNSFNDVDTRPRIRDEFEQKYADVLEQYRKELIDMETLFEANKHSPPVPKNMPPDSGGIAWARSIITRVKVPIELFKQKP